MRTSVVLTCSSRILKLCDQVLAKGFGHATASANGVWCLDSSLA